MKYLWVALLLAGCASSDMRLAGKTLTPSGFDYHRTLDKSGSSSGSFFGPSWSTMELRDRIWGKE